MSESPPPPPPPPADSPPAVPSAQAPAIGTPAHFLRTCVGKRIIVRLVSGVDYRGIMSCLDSYMNIAMEQTEEFANGRKTNTYGDAFIRGNNVLYISLVQPL